MAEAAVKGWITDDANALYQRGIEVAIGTVHNKVYAQTGAVSSADIATYVAAHTLSTDAEKAKEQINTQAWFLHFANPLEAWANLRRSDYPALYERTQFGQGQNGYQDLENNMDQPVRLYYPQEEINYNRLNYLEVVNDRMGGFSWHKRMWWDVKDQHYKAYVQP
jgi:pyruvate/2-oxoacid:ferredoxin oxidoreductase beta subunit